MQRLTQSFTRLTIIMLLALSGGYMLMAQTPESPENLDEPAEAEIDCDPVMFVLQQAELHALLDNFEGDFAEDEATALETLYEVGQAYQEMALACGHIPDDVNALVINTTDIDRVLTVLETLSGDPVNGQLLYNGQANAGSGAVLGCSGCHEQEGIAPPTAGTWTRWDEERSELPEYADKSFEYYAAESILLPWDYFVPTYPEFTMPDFYSTQLSYQDLADIIAYLSSQDQLPE